MSVVLSEHLPLLSKAPEGIQKLRGLILELAVRGKLVPQDPNDEPASELLKRIAQERARLEVGTTRKKSALTPHVGEDEQPFALPEGWAWGRMSDIANSQAGFAFKSAAFNDARIGMPLIRIRDVGFSDPTTYFDGPFREEFVVTKGDYLVSMDGQFRVAEWKGPNALLNQRVSRLQFYATNLAQAFFAISLHIRLAELQGVKAYTTVDHLSGGQISAAVVGVPPLTEQHRIVAKVDELMALCDRLEAEQTDAEAAHAKLVETLLGTLIQSPNAADLATNWQRLAEHFHTLFTTESSLDALKQTILQLAVMGKLVPQDPNDEPASELLKRIAKERARLEAEGACKKSKPLPPVGEDEQVFQLAEGWEYVRLQELCSVVTDGTHQTPKYTESGRPFLSAQNVKPFRFIPDFYRYVSEADYQGYVKTTKPEFGDVLLTRVGAMIGEAAVIDKKMDFAIYVSLALLKPMRPFVSSEYVTLWLNSPFGTHSSIRDTLGRGVSAGNLNLGMIRAFALPLPPTNEQHRIVVKVDELMALCDRLKADLAESRTRQARLSATLIESTLEAA